MVDNGERGVHPCCSIKALHLIATLFVALKRTHARAVRLPVLIEAQDHESTCRYIGWSSPTHFATRVYLLLLRDNNDHDDDNDANHNTSYDELQLHTSELRMSP